VDLVSLFRESHSPVLARAFPRLITGKNPALVAIGMKGAKLSGDLAIVPQKRAEFSADGWSSLREDLRT
jgi:hypothetical protein